MKIKFSLVLIFAIFLIPFAHSEIVANWTFNEGLGSTVYDSSPYGNNCSIINATWVDGVKGKALSFDGENSYITCGNDSSIDFNNETNFTIMGWFNIKANEGYFLLKSNSEGDAYYGIATDSMSGFICDYTWHEASFVCGLTSMINYNQWYHVTCIKKGNSWFIYLDGNLNNTCSYEGTINSASNIHNLSMGGNSAFNPTVFDLIDEVKIYNTSLTTSEIQQIYNPGSFPAPEFPFLAIPIGIAILAPILGYYLSKKRD